MFGRNQQGKRIDRLVCDMYFKPSVWREFRENPDQVGAKYSVAPDVVESIKNGDWRVLLDKGMDRRLMADPAYRLVDRMRISVRRFAVVALTLTLGFAVGAPRANARGRGLPIAGNRISSVVGRLTGIGEAGRARLRLRKREGSLDTRYKRINDGIDNNSAGQPDLSNSEGVIFLDPVE